MSDWLERELTHQLAAVVAPESLWDRIRDGQAARAKRSFEWTRWPLAAALALAIAGATAWQFDGARRPASSMQALALGELQDVSRDPRRFDFRSADPVAIAAWVKTETNIALHLPRENGAVRLLGARMIARGENPIAAIAYEVGGARAALLVSRTAPGDRTTTPKHTFAKMDSARIGLFSWSMDRQVYLLACSAKDPQVACQLCHVGSERLTAID
jgi:hypothetical protein